MNVTKNILLGLFLIWSTIILAQTTADLNCEYRLDTIEREIESQSSISYKMVFSQKLYTDESFEFSEGIIVINDFYDKIQPIEIVEIIARIGVKNKLTKIIAFKKCEAARLFFSQSKLTNEQLAFVNNNLIAEVDIDQYKSLDKKEKKKHKKMLDLIESVSNESCEKLTNFSKDGLSMEKINQVVSSTSAKYVEKTMKAYEMSFEESVNEFLKDLTNHLMFDCEIMKEFAKNYREK